MEGRSEGVTKGRGWAEKMETENSMYCSCSNYWNTIIKLKWCPFRQRSYLGVWSVSLLGGGQTFQSKEWRRRRRVRGRTKSCRVRGVVCIV